MAKITLEDISQATGFSKATISRVINGKGDESRIPKSTQDKILETAKSKNFVGKKAAQNLRNNNRHSIGLIVPDLSNPFFAKLASSIVTEAKRYKYMIMVMDTHDDVKSEEMAVREFVGRGAEGIIIVPCGDAPAFLESMQKEIPIVLVDRYFQNSTLPYISTNNFEGAYLAMKQLLGAGHRNILCIQGPAFSVTTSERLRGCRQAITDFGAKCHFYARGNAFSVENGYVMTKIAQAFQPRPTAIFAMSSTILLGAIQAIKEQGLHIPEDISIVTYDNNQFMDFLNPPVTRIAQPVEKIGQAAMKILYEKIAEGNNLRAQILANPMLIVRNSVAAPAATVGE